jgi:hypothetical protein
MRSAPLGVTLGVPPTRALACAHAQDGAANLSCSSVIPPSVPYYISRVSHLFTCCALIDTKSFVSGTVHRTLGISVAVTDEQSILRRSLDPLGMLLLTSVPPFRRRDRDRSRFVEVGLHRQLPPCLDGVRANCPRCGRIVSRVRSCAKLRCCAVSFAYFINGTLPETIGSLACRSKITSMFVRPPVRPPLLSLQPSSKPVSAHPVLHLPCTVLVGSSSATPA